MARTFWAILLAGCQDGVKDALVDAALPVDPGIALGLRDGEAPALGGRSTVAGSFTASPDASGFVFWLDLTPGRTPASTRWPGSAVAHVAPSVRPEAVSGATATPLPLAALTVDPTVEVAFGAGELAGVVPANVVEVDGALWTEAYELGAARLTAADREAMPGDLLGVRNDVDVEPIVLDQIWTARGSAGDEDVQLADEATVAYTATVDPGSPLLAGGAELWVWSASRGYWTYGGGLAVDATTREATFALGSIGWFALGRSGVPRACVTGRVVAEGQPVPGAEVKLLQDGVVRVDRASTESDGSFCLPMDPASRADLRVVGFLDGREAMVTAAASAVTADVLGTCAPVAGCVDVGDLDGSVWPDVDEDLHWSGPGGDCDDEDPAVNPNPTLGDGSYCGGAL